MKRIIIIMPENKADEANDWLLANIGPDCADTFIPSLADQEDKDPTHAICDWLLRDEDYDKLVAEFSQGWGARIAEGMPYLDKPTEGRKNGRGFMEERGLKSSKKRKSNGNASR